MKDFQKITDLYKDFKNDFLKYIKLLSKKQDDYLTIKNNPQNFQNSEYQRDFEQMKRQIEFFRNIQELKSNISENISDKNQQQSALNLLNLYKEAEPLAEKLYGSSKELENIFTKSFTKMIDGSEDFGKTVKNLLNDLKSYFIKTITEAAVNGLISSAFGNNSVNLFKNLGSYSGGSVFSSANFIFEAVKSLFGSHHSGGFIPNGTGNLSVPGSAEYLTVLKGGEHVYSPSEKPASQNKQNIVINNFNVQAWDSKNVQQYLLENKNILAGITADNIKYNNANLRYMINGNRA